MKLLEHRGKNLLQSVGIRVPPSIVTDNRSYINLSHHKERYKEFFFEHGSVVVKAQVIAGSRKKNGLIVFCEDYAESLKQIDSLYKTQYGNTTINTLLIEKKIPIESEYFLAIRYDTKTRKPTVYFSAKGGIDIEQSGGLVSLPVSALDGLFDFQARNIVKSAGVTGRTALTLAQFIGKAWHCFVKFDCKELEINPIIKTPEGLLFAGDAKITIDDSAVARQSILSDLTEIEDTSLLNEREQQARKIDMHDHRGVAGKTYLDLDGDIAVLASGGGASLTCMDSLIEASGKPANYTEYSGNPTAQKVEKLTKLTLDKPDLKGCLVVGGRANFTDIYETLLGFCNGLKAIKPKFTAPVVIRRAGPRADEAFEMVEKFAKEEGYDITLFNETTPMSRACEIMVEKTKEYGTH